MVEDLLRAGRYAELRELADSGDDSARFVLARLLQVAGLTDELLARARADEVAARRCAAQWAAEQGDLAVLRELADACRDTDRDWEPRMLFARALAERDAVDELRTRAEAGDRWASGSLSRVLGRRGEVAELRTREAAGHKDARWQLVELPLGEDELRARADAGDDHAADKLASLLTAEGRLAEATAVARTRATRWRGQEQLAKLLVRQGLVDELRERGANRDYSSAAHLLDLLARRRDLELLRELADEGFHKARKRLIEVMEKEELVDELLAYARPNESYRLPRLLARDHRLDDLRALVAAGDNNAPYSLACLLKDLGHADELRELAEGDGGGMYQYVELLAAHGRVAELTAMADAGNTTATSQLHKVLDEPAQRARADAGDEYLRRLLTNQFDREDRLDDLRAAVAAGWESARQPFTHQLAKQGHIEELRRLAESGERYARSRYLHWLTRQDDLAPLRTHADGGDALARERLAGTLARRGLTGELYDRAAAGDLDAARELAELAFPDDDEDRPDY